jgi:hypothetical protein
VTARAGGVLTVKGARHDRADGATTFRGVMSVLVGSETVVTALGLGTGPVDDDAISVGQRITAFGELTDDQILDATMGRVRMRISSLTGEVLQVAPLVVDLAWFNGLRPRAYDFTGTGTSGADADPEHYELDVASLDLSTLGPSNLVRVRGIVSPYGAAPPDFLARTVIDVDLDDTAAALWVSWASDGGTSTPFLAMAPARLDVDLSNARSLLAVRGVPRPFLGNVESIALEPGVGRSIYAVAVRGGGEIHLYRDFADLVTELGVQLDAGRRMTRILSRGRYNATTEVLTTPRASFEFIAP